MKAKSSAEKNRQTAQNLSGKTRSGVANDLLIVAIGASAGGIEAFNDLIGALPADTGMAFVLIQHLDPKHHSLLTELISKKTLMPAREVTDGMTVEPDHVYVIPPNVTMSISCRKLHLGPREESRVAQMPIDHFMRALADDQGNRAIGVILSGTGTDGTHGVAEIQAQGGVTFAQDNASAKYDGMPRSAVATGRVDYVLPPKGIARELARIARHPYVASDLKSAAAEVVTSDDASLDSIFNLLRRSTGVDFTHYRQSTILRRIQRRMVVHRLDKLEEYVKYVQANPSEVMSLYKDVLINVTSFFRNARVFDALKSLVFPNVLKNHEPESSIRIWTPGCASGEETFSIAIALLEYLGDRAQQIPIQFFGTDISGLSITKARSGLYADNIQADVSPERLRRFFTKVEGGYRIGKNIRDICIFAQHNLLNDPPFSQMDLICCRNLLIYLEPVLQNKVISLFHYATRPRGYLVLGASEGLGTLTNLFAPEDRPNKIFSKKSTASRQSMTFTLNHSQDRTEYGPFRTSTKQSDPNWNYSEAQKEFDRKLLTQYAPATVFINEDMEIIHTRGTVDRFLKLSPGRASLSILKMAREGLLLDLRNSIGKAKKEQVPVHKQGIRIKNGTEYADPKDVAAHKPESSRSVTFDVFPINIGSLNESYFMIIFQDVPAETSAASTTRRARGENMSLISSRGIVKLEKELASTKEYLQSVIETQEATNEELQSANEEILSSNEELQSTNEELETAKEELQSTNEELSTVNDELRSRNLEVTQVNNDLTNLFAGIDVAVLMIGSDLTIRRFTPQAQKFLGMIPGDVGRPFVNINPPIEIPDFQALVLKVISNRQPVEKEIKGDKGDHYQLRILPYRTFENKIDGAVITVVHLSP
ncbi:MAG TPA: chemotaxis protein CheB [Candidatus Acidoferrales bacterium]|nr:chemotaxis protein CheB [Candidatus Acidoferrales bacterium]